MFNSYKKFNSQFFQRSHSSNARFEHIVFENDLFKNKIYILLYLKYQCCIFSHIYIYTLCVPRDNSLSNGKSVRYNFNESYQGRVVGKSNTCWKLSNGPSPSARVDKLYRRRSFVCRIVPNILGRQISSSGDSYQG